MSKAYKLTRDREYGLKRKLGTEDDFCKTLYSSFFRRTSANESEVDETYGAVFGLEFSPDSSLLVSAREKNSFNLWDPISLKEIHGVTRAHEDSVNAVKFLNNNTFATCSDDLTVAIWDVRNLKTRKFLLTGHRNWIKNVEYDDQNKILLSSSFDGCVYAWSLNGPLDDGNMFKKIFHTTGLMRTKLSDDGTMLVMCTTGGYIIVIHNLDINKLAEDLDGFKPNIFRLMQIGRQFIPVAADYNYLFKDTRLRNRVELVSDFPNNNDAQVISSLQIHPNNWCAVSRYTSNNETSEWTCAHDIQQYYDSESEDEIVEDILNTSTETNASSTSVSRSMSEALRAASRHGAPTSDLWEAALSVRDEHNRRVLNNGRPNTNPQHQFMDFIARLSSGLSPSSLEAMERAAARSPYIYQNLGSQNFEATLDSLIASRHLLRSRSTSTNSSPQASNNSPRPSTSDGQSSGSNDSPRPSTSAGHPTGSNDSPRPSTSRDSRSGVSIDDHVPSGYTTPPLEFELQDFRFYYNRPRMLRYMEESNTGIGYIKEVSFSKDGRVICSPCGYGVRLLAFDDKCSELCMTKNDLGDPIEFNSICQAYCHKSTVVSTRFNQRHSYFVSGCLYGQIVCHNPVL